MEKQHEHLMETYFQEKEVFKRNEILRQLLLDMPVNAKDFFLKAFKKERYLDMKLSAVRGYAVYATQEEVTTLMHKLLELLKKRPKNLFRLKNCRNELSMSQDELAEKV